MRLLNFRRDGVTTLGAAVGGPDGRLGIVDLGSRLADQHVVDDVLVQGTIDDARRVVDQLREVDAGGEELLDPRSLTYERPVLRPGKILCIGVNYGGRNAEYRDGQDAPQRPSVFVRFPGSLVGHEHDLVRPPESDQLDYEGEIVAVIGRAGRRIPASAAREHIAGLTIGNEGTIRDWVRHAKFNVTQGKNWERSGALGPWIVTLDEVGPFDELRVTTHVNGELRQDDTVASMAFPIEEQVAYLSTFTTLEPGDLIFTGTPTGAGARFDPPRFLRPGDTIEVTVDGIGTLRNGVRDE